MISLTDLLKEAEAASGPMLVENKAPNVGGVDPLGLRQINFDLMDQVLPGLNNVADRVRPFVIVAWAWRRARKIVEQNKQGGATEEEMRDFVDRIEAIYAWSQFLVDPAAGIPGGQALVELVSGTTTSYHFGGDAWIARRDLRRTSTGLISPLNYGPGLRNMGWLIPVGPPGVFRPHLDMDSTLDAFEKRFEGILDHSAFNTFGGVTVDREDVRNWAAQWSIGELTVAEQEFALHLLAGPGADRNRRDGLALVEAAIALVSKEDRTVERIRAAMSETGNENVFEPPISSKAVAWREVQKRQLFRLALEGMFHWLVGELVDGPRSTESIADRFTSSTSNPAVETAAEWLKTDATGPVELLTALDEALRDDGSTGLPDLIKQALAFCLSEADIGQSLTRQANDRLPISRAQKEFERWRNLSPRECVAKIVEVWILAQHAYWCVGRGLADARGRGKTLLRLRIVIDEGGWTLTPGARRGAAPIATPDRLRTAVRLLTECGRI